VSFSIRTAGPRDATALAELAAVTFGLACPPHTTDAAKAAFIAEVLSEQRFDAYLADPSRDLLIAEDTDDGQALGYTMLVHGEPTDPDVADALSIHPTIELSKCYVLATHHSSGIADALMSASVDAGLTRGAEGMWLGVNEENARAQRFYAKNGFVRVGSKHFLVGGTLENDWVMERPLE
jgi:diamine N-acetyltransferase